MPPAHMADFDSETLQQKVQELGLPKFRADQIRRQYFGRLQGDPMKMTDLPEAKRAAVKEALFPELMQPIRNMEADDGETRKTLWRLHDDALPGSGDVVHFLSGRLRYGLSLLCDGAGRTGP